VAQGIPTVVLGAAQSGAGKTTATMVLIAGLRRRGLKVQPFKVGPDYLDPALLSWVAGRTCLNLDAWLVPPEHLSELFHRACVGADVAVVEGVMGLFDGRSGSGDQASTAAVARHLGASVVLVLDASRAARTVGAVGLGLSSADPSLPVAGAILNRISSERHLETCLDGMRMVNLKPLGYVGRASELTLPDRYLGLISPHESAPPLSLRTDLERASESLDLAAILAAARPATANVAAQSLFPTQPLPIKRRIAIAKDRAFHFYYQDSLDLLEAWGAELVPFSPLGDRAVPAADAVYLGGGYPELFAAELGANRPMIESLRSAHEGGALIYAECGGAMYAAAGIECEDGQRHPMVGLWPGWMSLRRSQLTVGYRQVRSVAAGFLDGWELPAHEFHRSQVSPAETSGPSVWRVLDQGDRQEGFSSSGLIATYIHLHFGSKVGLAQAFIESCPAA
jgi:cobyrinic acid a,c-diamide synthase